MMENPFDRISMERKNLSLVCRFAVKTLIDKSCYQIIDEYSAEFLNFSVILEQVFNHQFKGRTSWYRGRDARSVWDFVRQACKNVPNNCLKNVQNFEHIKTGYGKVRAWVRVALMEKKLSEYISAALKQSRITGSFYGEGALLLGDEADTLTKTLLGLNAIDFSFDLKGANLDEFGCTVIDYSPYLNFQQCAESVTDDAAELRVLSNSSSSQSISLSPDELFADRSLNPLEQYRIVVQQKGYLEELLRLRDAHLAEGKETKRKLTHDFEQFEKVKFREIHQLETVVIELQAQLQTLKRDYQRLQKYTQRNLSMTSPSRQEYKAATRFRYSTQDGEVHSLGSDERLDLSDQTNYKSSHDSRSLLSDSSAVQLRDESSSMTALNGSVNSLNDLDKKRQDLSSKDFLSEVENNNNNNQINTETAEDVLKTTLKGSFDLPLSDVVRQTSDDGSTPGSIAEVTTVYRIHAQVHRTDSNVSHDMSPITEQLTPNKVFYNLGADNLDRESSEERMLENPTSNDGIKESCTEDECNVESESDLRLLEKGNLAKGKIKKMSSKNTTETKETLNKTGTITNETDETGTITNETDETGTITNETNETGTITNETNETGTITNETNETGTITNETDGTGTITDETNETGTITNETGTITNETDETGTLTDETDETGTITDETNETGTITNETNGTLNKLSNTLMSDTEITEITDINVPSSSNSISDHVDINVNEENPLSTEHLKLQITSQVGTVDAVNSDEEDNYSSADDGDV